MESGGTGKWYWSRSVSRYINMAPVAGNTSRQTPATVLKVQMFENGFEEFDDARYVSHLHHEDCPAIINDPCGH